MASLSSTLILSPLDLIQNSTKTIQISSRSCSQFLRPTSFHGRHRLRFSPRLLNSSARSSNRLASVAEEHDVVEKGEPIVDEEVKKSVKVLKDAAKTRRTAAEEILTAFSIIEKANIDSSRFFETLGGTSSPGRTWMLVFTAEKKLTGGRYFPLTAIQRFDAAARRIENGVFLGPIGSLTFEGRLSWKKRVLAFIFERIRIKVGPLNPLEINIGKKEEREPSNKDPFFIWFYVDEEIAVARGKSGGTAFWCRCSRVNT